MEDCHKEMQNEYHKHHFESHGPKRMLHVVLLVFFLFFLICGIETYSVGVSPTILYARVNDTFEISCFVDQAGEKLNFYDGNDLVPESYIKRINNSYIIYTNACTKPIKKNVTCKRVENIVGMSEVFIDEKFGSVRNFKCRTRDLMELTCTFQKPSTYHRIAYRLQYVINDGKREACRLKPNLEGGYFCKIKLHENALNSNFTFSLRAHNEFYKKRENFELTLMETLLPEKIEKVTVQLKNNSQYDSSSNDIFIAFTLPEKLEVVAKEMMFEIKLKATDENEWETLMYNNFDINRDNEKILILKNVKYANTIYQFELRMKTKSSLNTDEMWSPYIKETFKTNPKLPDMLPSVCKNCYNIMDNGNIFLYWTEVPKLYQNGDNFSYFLEIYNPKTNSLNNTFVSKTSLMMTNKVDAEYLRVRIYSSNDEGLSKEYSTIDVYMKQTKDLLRIKKELMNDKISYRLSWRPYENIIDIDSYTIIWCRQRSELPNQCDGPIEFLDVPSYEQEFNFSTSFSYQFGVAVNTFSGRRRGIQWAKCTSSRPDEIGTLHSIWTKYITENSISFEWRINCADKDIVSAFDIKYCIIADFDKNLCLEQETIKNFKVDNKTVTPNKYQISNLKPYKLYNISISMISTSDRSGAFSKPIMIRTLEGSPSAPQNLEAFEIQSNSIALKWNRPIDINGPSLTYQLWYNDKMIHIDNNETTNDTYYYQLKHLEQFTNYTITIVACTKECSPPSGSIMIRSKVGKPGRMHQIGIKTLKNGTTELSWQRPIHFNGYYLLNVTKTTTYESKELLYKINGFRDSCVIQSLNCDNYNYLFSIRGINVDTARLNVSSIFVNDSNDCFSYEGKYNEEWHYYGDISVPFDHCRINYSGFLFIFGNSPVELIIIVCILLFLVLCTIGCIMFKVYKKLQDMKDIQILWPDGFDPNNSSKTDSITSLSNFDLIKTCANLENIREESFKELELYENDNKSNENVSKMFKETIPNDDNKEHLVPLVTKSQTFDLINDASMEQKIKSFSVPTTPLKQVSNDDNKMGYITMHEPKRSIKNLSNPSVGGYLDMSGKPSTPPYINQNNEMSSNDIKSFIQNSQLNNGYIQRNSMKNSFPVIINSNGYAGLENFKK